MVTLLVAIDNHQREPANVINSFRTLKMTSFLEESTKMKDEEVVFFSQSLEDKRSLTPHSRFRFPYYFSSKLSFP